MLFNSLPYVIFLPSALAVYWLAPVARRVDVLLVSSYVFYASWSIPYAALIFVLAVANYMFGRVLARSRRRVLLACFVGLDLAILGFFKYTNFGLELGFGLVRAVTGTTTQPPLVAIVLPLGISFFTFEFVHYLVDIQRGSVPIHSFSKFHVFAAFFPTQIAGPIKRFQQFVPFLSRLDLFDGKLARAGLGLIAIGLTKKILFADTLAQIANVGFGADPREIGTIEAWSAALAFSLQIYFDFSGYTDIARGSAQLFGFRLPINFDAPYLAARPSEFWSRWHISLSTWLRDYVFIPLGGSRRGRMRTLRNLAITFLLGGLWHGAAWHFVAWGALWGALLIVERIASDLRAVRLPTSAGWLLTQVAVLFTWVMFRAPTLEHAAWLWSAMLQPRSGSGAIHPFASVLVGAVFIALVTVWYAMRRRVLPQLGPSMRPIAFGAAAAGALVAAITLAPPGAQRFIYFQF